MSKDSHSHLCQGFCDLETLYVNWYYAADIFRLPLQFFFLTFKTSDLNDLREAKNKTSGGRGISGMTAPN